MSETPTPLEPVETPTEIVDPGDPIEELKQLLADPATRAEEPVGSSPRPAAAEGAAPPEPPLPGWFEREGDLVILLGEIVNADDPLGGLGGSVWLRRRQSQEIGAARPQGEQQEKPLQEAVRGWAASGGLRSAQECGAGGLAVALARGCVGRPPTTEAPLPLGARIDLSGFTGPSLAPLLFGETPGRVVISVAPHQAPRVLGQAKLLELPAAPIGVVGGSDLKIKTTRGELAWAITELRALPRNSPGSGAT